MRKPPTGLPEEFIEDWQTIHQCQPEPFAPHSWVRWRTGLEALAQKSWENSQRAQIVEALEKNNVLLDDRRREIEAENAALKAEVERLGKVVEHHQDSFRIVQKISDERLADLDRLRAECERLMKIHEHYKQSYKEEVELVATLEATLAAKDAALGRIEVGDFVHSFEAMQIARKAMELK